MKRISAVAAASLISLLSAPSLVPALELPPAEKFHNDMGLQGYSGVLNTPSAHVTEEGWFYGLYTNQTEDMWRKKTRFQDNYLFSVGLFNFLELGGRFFEAPKVGRDLSAQVKITSAPLTKNYPLLPVIAAGIQDIGGGATLIRSRYVVASEDIWRLRLSAGYGNGPDRMKGFFAGGEFKAHDWVYLLGEYDTNETNVGARVVLPQFWKVPIRFTATAKTSLNHEPGNFDFAAGLTVPLDFKIRSSDIGHRTSQDATSDTASPDAVSPDVRRPKSGVAPQDVRRPEAEVIAASADVPGPRSEVSASNVSDVELLERLNKAGFLEARVGRTGRTLVVEYENALFNHNELDAMGMVAGLASRSAGEELDTLRMVVKRHGIAMVQVTAPLVYVRDCLARPEGVVNLRDHLLISYDTARAADGVSFVTGDNRSNFLHTSLVLYPGLTTWVGTEVGVFDYLLSLKAETTTTLWKGGMFSGRWDLPLSWSDNLENGKMFRGSRNDARVERLMLFQAFKPLPDVMLQLGGGMILHGQYGFLNEAMWNPGQGSHRLRLVQGWSENSISHDQKKLLLGSYRYYFSPLNLYLEGTGGRFWAEDVGFSTELKRFWGDTSVSVYYKNTRGVDDKRWEAAGIQFSFPLTPRKDLRPVGPLQVRGTDEWSYAQETTLKNNNYNNVRGSLNYFAPYPLAINPQPPTALYRAYYNRDRLSEKYIKQNLERWREAWQLYGEQVQ